MLGGGGGGGGLFFFEYNAAISHNNTEVSQNKLRLFYNVCSFISTQQNAALGSIQISKQEGKEGNLLISCCWNRNLY